jgi:micrococcal nuclease
VFEKLQCTGAIFLLFFALVPSRSHAQIAIVDRVIDGDTLLLTTGEKVRLIGIDAPESKVNPRAGKQVEWEGKDLKTIISMGEQATRFVESLVKPGDQVRIEFDVEKRDQYGRLLGYVYLPDGRMLNEEIVRERYASLMTVPPKVNYQERLLRAYREARENKRGLWR